MSLTKALIPYTLHVFSLNNLKYQHENNFKNVKINLYKNTLEL